MKPKRSTGYHVRHPEPLVRGNMWGQMHPEVNCCSLPGWHSLCFGPTQPCRHQVPQTPVSSGTLSWPPEDTKYWVLLDPEASLGDHAGLVLGDLSPASYPEARPRF